MVNSLKQFLRKPLKVTLLIILIMSSAITIIYGFTLFRYSKQQLELLESTYSTVGFIEQKATSTQIKTIYDPSSQSYTHYKTPVFEPLLTEDVLWGYTNYMIKPEKRPFYVAYMKDCHTSIEDTVGGFQNTIEFTPVENSITDKPILVRITNVLDGSLKVEDQIWLYNYYDDEKRVLKKDKKYIAMVGKMNNLSFETKDIDDVYVPMMCPTSILYDESGHVRESTINKNELIEEVTPHFYTKERGRYWKNMMNLIKRFEKSIPVLPTDGLELLESFHSYQAYIVEGRKISQDEFESGLKVCMVSKKFADMNQLSIGDVISLPLYLSNHNESSQSMFDKGYDVTFLDTTGEQLLVFSNHKYKIVGIYDAKVGLSDDSELSEDTVIIPASSVNESDQNNIISVGPMRKTTTSFQIPNGTMDEYKKWFEENSFSQLFDLTLDDGGYEKVQSEMNANLKTAGIMSVIGIITFLLTIIVIVYFFIIKESQKIAINRSLGMSKKQCCMTILSGLIVITLIASTLGSIISYRFISNTDFSNDNSYYSFDYSQQTTVNTSEMIELNDLVPVIVYMIPICYTLLVASISIIIIYKNIDSHLMILLNTRNH